MPFQAGELVVLLKGDNFGGLMRIVASPMQG
jgi:hypothetical protein